MKSYKLLVIALLFCTASGYAQVTISGTVKNISGEGLRNAFVQDKEYKSGIYTDSLGNFSLQTHANPILNISYPGYKDTTVKATAGTNLVIVLRATVSVNGTAIGSNDVAGTANTDLLRNNLREEITHGISGATNSITRGAQLTEIHEKEATQGSRFLFPYWAHGYLVNSKDSLIQNAILLFDYDKMGGTLLFTQDQRQSLSIDMDKVRSFTVFDRANQRYTFAPVPEIDPAHYVQVIGGGANYRIYKQIKTTFTAANFKSDGMMNEGNKYDEYKDESTYYVFDVKANKLHKTPLRKKALKDAFPNDLDKLNKFMKDNDSDIDDNYLATLADYMNQ